MIINHNIAALNTYRQLSNNNAIGAKSLEKLSSGLRINRAGDDAAGLAISEKMRGQIRGLDQAARNAQDAISMIQTAEGALNETHSILQRMRELAVQAANDTATQTDRNEIQKEVDQLAKEITRISNTTEFNTKNLLGGGLNATYHIGANQGQEITLSVNAMDAYTLGVASAQNQLGAFVAGATGLTASAFSNEGLGRGLSAQTYTIAVTHNAASTSEISDTVTGGADISGTYTGDRNETVIFKVTGVSSNQVTAVEYSTDGGTSWAGITVTGGSGSSTVTYKGTTITFTDDASNAVGQSATYQLNARNDSIQLKDSGDTNIGSAVTVYADMTSVTIGDAATGRTMLISSTSLGDLTSGTATQAVTQQASSAATFNNDGSFASQAVAVAGVDVSSQAAANTAITTINNAIERVSAERSKLGAYQNRLEHTINNLGTASENLSASESRIRDVDYAKAA
ncbi:flagellin [Desulfallas thermosapovorans]|uniref:Flagellin n=1 Tax=Desulfallas thermosapovorans DSM 6562 TaxID=1121431 RepID=A0A5S4ZRU4_9FIRM|nr:flagellin [Desulfallas thermosapovorans]TYO95525.1 flagellin [Desulfallas thermosapovorans DSM 6562]